jgi:hypothetical protein
MADEIVSLSVNYTSPLSRSPTAALTTNCKASGIRDQIEPGVLLRGVKFDIWIRKIHDDGVAVDTLQ